MKRFLMIFLIIFIINIYAESDNPFTKYKEKKPVDVFEKKSDTLKDTLETQDSLVDSAKVDTDTIKIDTLKTDTITKNITKEDTISDSIVIKTKELEKDTLQKSKENTEIKKEEKNIKTEKKEFDYEKLYNKGKTEAAKINKTKDCITRMNGTIVIQQSAWFVAHSGELTDEEINAFSDGFYDEIAVESRENRDNTILACIVGSGCISAMILFIKAL